MMTIIAALLLQASFEDRLVAALDSDSPQERDRAEIELIRLGDRGTEALKHVLQRGAGPEVRERAERILMLTAPNWTFDPAAAMRQWHRARFGVAATEHELFEVIFSGQAADIGRQIRIFESAWGVMAVDRMGNCGPWNATIDAALSVVSRAGLKAMNEQGMREISDACFRLLAFPDARGAGRKLQIIGRTAVLHRRGYANGKLAHVEDVTLTFDELGELKSIERKFMPGFDARSRINFLPREGC